MADICLYMQLKSWVKFLGLSLLITNTEAEKITIDIYSTDLQKTLFQLKINDNATVKGCYAVLRRTGYIGQLFFDQYQLDEDLNKTLAEWGIVNGARLNLAFGKIRFNILMCCDAISQKLPENIRWDGRINGLWKPLNATIRDLAIINGQRFNFQECYYSQNNCLVKMENRVTKIGDVLAPDAVIYMGKLGATWPVYLQEPQEEPRLAFFHLTPEVCSRWKADGNLLRDMPFLQAVQHYPYWKDYEYTFGGQPISVNTTFRELELYPENLHLNQNENLVLGSCKPIQISFLRLSGECIRLYLNPEENVWDRINERYPHHYFLKKLEDNTLDFRHPLDQNTDWASHVQKDETIFCLSSEEYSKLSQGRLRQAYEYPYISKEWEVFWGIK